MPNLTLSEYAAHDAVGLAEGIRTGAFSAGDVIDAAFRAIDACNGAVNAVTRPLREYAEASLATRPAAGALHGVPIVLKDEYQHLPGVPTEHGARISRGFVVQRESELVARMQRAGLIVVGKSNLPEFGASVTCEPVAHGICRNPWDVGRTSGASSGGSAAAVASRMVPLGYANDGAGSIRIPASCCGLFGLKPSRGRMPTGPYAAELWNGLVAEHVLTRSVRDSAAVLDAVHGPDDGAPYAAPAAPASYLAVLRKAPAALRIGLSVTPPAGGEAHPQVVDAARAAAALCEDLGHHVEWASPKHDAAAMYEAIGSLLAIHLAHGIDELSRATGIVAHPGNVEAANWMMARRARGWPATRLLQLQSTFNDVCREAGPFWREHDVWLTPTLGLPPVAHGFITPLLPDPDLYLQRWIEFCPFTPLANVLGAPSMSVPLHHDDQGLPIGVCFTAAPGREDLLLALAAQLEAARPWHGRTPGVVAG